MKIINSQINNITDEINNFIKALDHKQLENT